MAKTRYDNYDYFNNIEWNIDVYAVGRFGSKGIWLAAICSFLVVVIFGVADLVSLVAHFGVR